METTCESANGGTQEVQLQVQAGPKVIEVERKFVLGKDIEATLKEHGAKLVKESNFTDVYYDTSDYKLTLNDHWLRKRNAQWQLKCPPEVRYGDTRSTRSTQYAEYEREETIVKALQVPLGREPLPAPSAAGSLPPPPVAPESPASTTTGSTEGCSNLQGLAQKASLNEFAQYTTQRKTYVLDGFTIDLDLTDFGFQVGEIEVVVADESRITEALHQIDELAVKLGVSSSRRLPGKMEMYLKTNKPEMYKKLIERHMIAEVTGEDGINSRR